MQKLQNEMQTLQLKIKQADPAQIEDNDTDILLAEKDSKIDELCNQLADARFYKKELEQAQIMVQDMRD